MDKAVIDIVHVAFWRISILPSVGYQPKGGLVGPWYAVFS
jgi:hypothetical protein